MSTPYSVNARPAAKGISWPVRLLTLALLFGGLAGGIGNLALVPPGFWVWDMPALAYRFLAAAAFSYVAGSLLTLTRSRWVESELLLATVNFYGWPLLLAILLQTDQLDWSKFMSWAFVAVVAPALAISVPYLWFNRRRVRREARFPLDPSLRIYLVVVGLAAMLVGLFVYIVPRQAGFIWPWAELAAWKLLDSRLIASMLLTMGAAAFLVAWRNDRGAAQLYLVMLGAYCIFAGTGVVLHALVTPAFVFQDLVYMVIFGVIFLVGLILFPRSPVSAAVAPHYIR
ncbi:MAG: hypothetical protein J0I20_12255 [Chloroflexi bacterium]|nr:hypothetical protein [Chloroflexota bacterium]OJV92496.1 MAG: hypothetical protein BGO39_31765 [Chloroflexi bacterium 54-19]